MQHSDSWPFSRLLQVAVSGQLGQPLTLTVTDNDGHTASADSGDVVLQPASKRPMTHDDVVAAVGQMGDNVLTPAAIDVSGLALDQGGLSCRGCTF